jgi:hypothetical protein
MREHKTYNVFIHLSGDGALNAKTWNERPEDAASLLLKQHRSGQPLVPSLHTSFPYIDRRRRFHVFVASSTLIWKVQYDETKPLNSTAWSNAFITPSFGCVL